MINGVNLPKMPLQLLGDIVDKAKVKQVNSVKEGHLTLHVLMDYSFWFDEINLGLSIVYMEGS